MKVISKIVSIFLVWITCLLLLYVGVSLVQLISGYWVEPKDAIWFYGVFSAYIILMTILGDYNSGNLKDLEKFIEGELFKKVEK